VSRGNVWIRISYKRLLGIKTLSISQEDFFASVAWRQPNDGGWSGIIECAHTAIGNLTVCEEVLDF